MTIQELYITTPHQPGSPPPLGEANDKCVLTRTSRVSKPGSLSGLNYTASKKSTEQQEGKGRLLVTSK